MKAKVRTIYQFKVSLEHIEPPIWRRFLVPAEITLPRLDRMIQSLFNWENYHLHGFKFGKHFYAEPDPEDNWFGKKALDERKVRLETLVNKVGDEFEYEYDFGDGWRHHLILEAILLPEAGVSYPRCIDGARNGPPEDVGGPPGYQAYLHALSDPTDPRHEDMLAWRGPFDPEAFSIRGINASLKPKKTLKDSGVVIG